MEEQILQPGSAQVKKRLAPHAISALVWSIVSIVTMMYFGWVAAIVAFSLRNKGLKVYNENPSTYNEKSLNLLKTAKTCSIIGLIVSIFTTIIFIAIIAMGVMAARYNNYNSY